MSNIMKLGGGGTDMELVTCLYSTTGSNTTTTTSYTFTKAYSVAYAIFMSLSDTNRAGEIISYTGGDATLYSMIWRGWFEGSGNYSHNPEAPTRIVRYDNVPAGKTISMTDGHGGGHFILVFAQE